MSPYPTTRELNDRIASRKVLASTESSTIPSSGENSPFSPRKALAKAQVAKAMAPSYSPSRRSPFSAGSSKLPVPSSPTSAPSSTPSTKAASVDHSSVQPRKPVQKRADNSWLRKGTTPNTSTPLSPLRTSSNVAFTHSRKRSETIPSPKYPSVSPVADEASASVRRGSELPNTLLRKHILAQERNATSGTEPSLASLTSVESPSALPRKPSLTRTTAPPPSISVTSSTTSSPNGTSSLTVPSCRSYPDHVKSASLDFCAKRGHPFNSYFIPYLCSSCERQRHEAERDRRARLAASLEEDVLVERVKLQEWQWRTRFESPKKMKKGDGAEDTASGAAEKGWTMQTATRGTGQSGDADKEHAGSDEGPKAHGKEGVKVAWKRMAEAEAEMLRKMEEANRTIAEAEAASRVKVVESVERKSEGDEKSRERRSWVRGLRRSWGSEGKAEERMKGSGSWRISRLTAREEY